MNPLTAVLFVFAVLFSMSAGSPSMQYHVEADSSFRAAVNALVSQLRITKNNGAITYSGASSGAIDGYPNFQYSVFKHTESQSIGSLKEGFIHIKLDDKRSNRTSSYKVGLYVSYFNSCFRFSSMPHDPMNGMAPYNCFQSSYELTVDPY